MRVKVIFASGIHSSLAMSASYLAGVVHQALKSKGRVELTPMRNGGNPGRNGYPGGKK